MMVVHPGDLRVFSLVGRTEVFVPTDESEVASFLAALLPEAISHVRVFAALEGAFPLIATAYRQVGVSEIEAEIGAILEHYDDEPEAIALEIATLIGAYDLRLTFRDRTVLARFLRAYEAMTTPPRRSGRRRSAGTAPPPAGRKPARRKPASQRKA
jgi:hypothetical protein